MSNTCALMSMKRVLLFGKRKPGSPEARQSNVWKGNRITDCILTIKQALQAPRASACARQHLQTGKPYLQFVCISYAKTTTRLCLCHETRYAK